MQQESLLLRTKFRKPPITGGIISRPGLLKRLDDASCLPLMLLVAPAGYGKTTLLSSWLDNQTKLYTWLSLNERDNNLNLFVSYLLAAIKTLFPGACKETSIMLTRPDFPPPELLTLSLINEIDEIETDFLLVLDDYHYIRDMAVHNLLSELLRHPPHHLHLVISTRRDPSLPLVNLRAQRRMVETRVPELRLSLSEATDFIRQTMRLPLDNEAIAILWEKTEGWIAALFLTALSLGRNPDINQIPAILKEKDTAVIDYLLDEVSSRLPSTIREFLLKISILDTFCASLCDAICQDLESNSPVVPSLQYMQWIERENLFVFPVDEEHLWYRFHQLFHHFLERQLEKTYSPEEIARFHTRASHWLAEYKLFEEAIRHALKAGNTALALQQAAQYRHDLRTHQDWRAMERLLKLFPPHLTYITPDLLMDEAWVKYARFQWEQIPGILDQIESLLVGTDRKTNMDTSLRGEINVFRSLQYYRAGDYQQALVFAEQSLIELPEDWLYARGIARLHKASVYQVSGKLKEAYALLGNGVNQVYFSHNLSVYLNEQRGLCYIQWMAGDLQNLKITAANALAVAEKNELELHTGTMHYFLGIVDYYQNNLAEAENHLKTAFGRWHATPTLCATGSGFGLALTYRAQGNYYRAREVVKELKEHLLRGSNTLMVPYTQIFQAELNLLSGDLNAAVKTAMGFNPPLISPMLGFYYPRFTLVKIWLSQNTFHSRQQASDLLTFLHEFTESTHNDRFLMDVLALQALLYARLNNEKSAQVSLKQAVALAKKAGAIRNFVDMGSGIANLLQHLDTGEELFVQQILEAFESETPIRTVTASEVPKYHLTDREIKILGLLAQRLSNKEIAAQMVISSGTVKSHTIRIYQKLNARSRRQAVEKALTLGIIASI